MPYMTFVNSMSLEDKPGDWITEELQLPCPNVPCERFMTHMNLSHDASSAHKVLILLFGSQASSKFGKCG